MHDVTQKKERHMRNSEQMSEFETYLNERQRMTTASLSAIEKAGPGQRDGAHKRQQTLTELTPSCGVA
jgi:hypothetical protein